MVAPISREDKVGLWRQDSRCAKYGRLKEAFDRSLAVDLKPYRKFTNWNPIPERHSRSITRLQERCNPAVIKEGKLYRIDTAEVDIRGTAFTWDPKIAEEITNVTLAGRFITFHTNGYPLFFKPSIHEVLMQLPESLTHVPGNLYFTTETISNDPEECAIGSFSRFHVAITSVYRRTVS